ncbi:MAG: hypothetical protein KatS3mg070_1548 [Meiothermus sp.]|nr:MAG: hypothetical protein KatS3mg070_1548 [Meiothermus sp.]
MGSGAALFDPRPAEAPQRKYDLREVFNALRWMVRTGAQWDYLPHDFPPPHIVQAQAYRWMNRGVFEDLYTTCA